ncbi:ATP-binding protein [Undibacterium sp. FT147W]|uniref:ATP-binding protein n=1 Tax=Undibacterium rivi TaxID=2828729 RepID=A0ABS5H754_9BURK|nr:ATP-binding protein [Undibacterium rivi]MBR7794397.1 ATP-binding protein [Undibacterium rivi]
MILEYGFENFFSFKEEVSVSFRLDSNCPESVSKGKKVSSAICIKGANGSGKTQLLKALAFLRHFSCFSFSDKPEDTIGLLPFFERNTPSKFYIEFIQYNVEYRYELEATTEAVVRERLYRKSNIKRVKIFERINNEIVSFTKSYSEINQIKLRKNASIISTLKQYEITVLDDVYIFFNSIDTNVTFSGFDIDSHDINAISRFLSNTSDKKILPFIVDFIQSCDTGVSDIQIQSYKDKDGTKIFYPVFLHQSNGKSYQVSVFNESSGTKTLFRVLVGYYMSLLIGGLLVVDEIDLSLHPHIIPKLISLFLDSETNERSAQIIFVTHDTEIMEQMGRYRTYLVTKEENESFAYRLDEIPGDLLRNDRPIRPMYDSGKIGGVPKNMRLKKKSS